MVSKPSLGRALRARCEARARHGDRALRARCGRGFIISSAKIHSGPCILNITWRIRGTCRYDPAGTYILVATSACDVLPANGRYSER